VNSNSAAWQSNYSTVNSNSASWVSDRTTVNTNSASWIGGNSAYTTVNSNSASWVSDRTTVNTNSAAWQSNYSTVNSNSASWSGDNYVFAYDTTNKPTTPINTWIGITYNTNAIINGWTHTTSTSSFICNQTGLYDILFTGLFTTTNNSRILEVRGLYNGSEILGSFNSVQAQQPARGVITSNFMVSAVSGSKIEMQYAISNAAITLTAPASLVAGSTSVSTTIKITKIV
jgi:hypothetical protein